VGGDGCATPALVKDGAVTDSYSDVVALYVEFVPELPWPAVGYGEKIGMGARSQNARGSLTAEYNRGFLLCTLSRRRRAAGV
jgi:hypothetical protein